MKTDELVQHLNDILDIENIPDESLNGLQVANSGQVATVALAVDASEGSIKQAAELGADLLLVHHGLFWGVPLALTGSHYNRIRTLMHYDLALYAVHLPLDSHPELGNNAQIGPLMNWPLHKEFGLYHGQNLGYEIHLRQPEPIENLVQTLGEKLQCTPKLWNFGKKEIGRIGYVSGGSMSNLEEAIQKRLDLFVTGEPKHTAYWTAKEAGINVLCAGHYATETLGVKAVGKYLEKQFGLKTVFIDLPTGL